MSPKRLAKKADTLTERGFWFTGCIGLTLTVGFLDYITGYELSFSIFYVLPIALAVWRLSYPFAICLCLLSAVIWYSMDALSGHAYRNHAILLWNSGVRLGYFVLIAHLLNGLKERLAESERMAQTDGLTGLLNSYAFLQSAETVCRLARRYAHPLAIGYLDLDNFKTVNDQRGHPEGDFVLKKIAKTLKQGLRASDIVGRLGGDEFVIVLPQTGMGGAKQALDKMLGELESLSREYEWPIGFSMGVLVWESFTGNFEQAIRRADDLMYQVKKTGKGRVVYESASPGDS